MEAAGTLLGDWKLCCMQTRTDAAYSDRILLRFKCASFERSLPVSECPDTQWGPHAA